MNTAIFLLPHIFTSHMEGSKKDYYLFAYCDCKYENVLIRVRQTFRDIAISTARLIRCGRAEVAQSSINILLRLAVLRVEINSSAKIVVYVYLSLYLFLSRFTDGQRMRCHVTSVGQLSVGCCFTPFGLFIFDYAVLPFTSPSPQRRDRHLDWRHIIATDRQFLNAFVERPRCHNTAFGSKPN